MSERHATFLLCDDCLSSISGKLTLAGIYGADILIPAPEIQIGQLVIFIIANTAADDPFRQLSVRVRLPGESDAIFPLPLVQPSANPSPERTLVSYRATCLVTAPVLRPGPIEVTVIDSERETPAGRQWIVSRATPPA